MKKFLRRSLGALALIGTTFGAKASKANEKHENVSQNVNVDSTITQKTENNLNKNDENTELKGLLFSIPTRKKIIENHRIKSLLQSMAKEAHNAILKASVVPFANFEKGVELTLPSEAKTYKYRLTDLPSDYKQAELKVYEKLVNYILAARIENLNKLNSNKKLSLKEKNKNKAKLYCYKKIDAEYIREYLSKKLNNTKNEIKWLKLKDKGGFSKEALMHELKGIFKGSTYRSTRDFN